VIGKDGLILERYVDSIVEPAIRQPGRIHMSQASIEGGCLCGAVRYRIAGKPLSSGTCQCRSCRRASAAAIVPWITVNTADFTFTAGQPGAYNSSPPATRSFCGRCGSPLTFTHTSYEGKKIDVTTVSLDNPEAFPPEGHLWTSQKLGWIRLADGLPCFEEGAPS
jgi:hypothetical protein